MDNITRIRLDFTIWTFLAFGVIALGWIPLVLGADWTFTNYFGVVAVSVFALGVIADWKLKPVEVSNS